MKKITKLNESFSKVLWLSVISCGIAHGGIKIGGIELPDPRRPFKIPPPPLPVPPPVAKIKKWLDRQATPAAAGAVKQQLDALREQIKATATNPETALNPEAYRSLFSPRRPVTEAQYINWKARDEWARKQIQSAEKRWVDFSDQSIPLPVKKDLTKEAKSLAARKVHTEIIEDMSKWTPNTVPQPGQWVERLYNKLNFEGIGLEELWMVVGDTKKKERSLGEYNLLTTIFIGTVQTLAEVDFSSDADDTVFQARMFAISFLLKRGGLSKAKELQSPSQLERSALDFLLKMKPVFLSFTQFFLDYDSTSESLERITAHFSPTRK